MIAALYILAGFIILCVAKSKYPQIGYEDSRAHELVIVALWPLVAAAAVVGFALSVSDKIASRLSAYL